MDAWLHSISFLGLYKTHGACCFVHKASTNESYHNLVYIRDQTNSDNRAQWNHPLVPNRLVGVICSYNVDIQINAWGHTTKKPKKAAYLTRMAP